MSDLDKLGQLMARLGELEYQGTPSSFREAQRVKLEGFGWLLRVAEDHVKPEPKPKRTIADNYPAGGLTASEPCTFCQDYERLKAEVERLKAELDKYGRTADHVRVVPGMKLYQQLAAGMAYADENGLETWVVDYDGDPAEYYSTPEAAQAAEKEKT